MSSKVAGPKLEDAPAIMILITVDHSFYTSQGRSGCDSASITCLDEHSAAAHFKLIALVGKPPRVQPLGECIGVTIAVLVTSKSGLPRLSHLSILLLLSNGMQISCRPLSPRPHKAMPPLLGLKETRAR